MLVRASVRSGAKGRTRSVRPKRFREDDTRQRLGARCVDFRTGPTADSVVCNGYSRRKATRTAATAGRLAWRYFHRSCPGFFQQQLGRSGMLLQLVIRESNRRR